MTGITFSYLEKSDFTQYAPGLFAILKCNMAQYAPQDSRADFSGWCTAYGGAFTHRKERQILLIFHEATLIGFFGYCLEGDTFLMEEIQLLPAYHGKYGIFRALYQHVVSTLPGNLRRVEAYADKENRKSIGILTHLGLTIQGENENRSCYQFRGEYDKFLQWLATEPTAGECL